MKKTQRIMSAALTLLMLLSVFLIPSTAAFKNGDIVNYYLYTDIVTYINGIPIRSYNIEGYTAVIVEDLANYGFDVVWSAAARTLKVTRNTSKRIIGGFDPIPNTRKVGSKAGEVYYTDIVTYFDGHAVKSYNIGGRTIAYVDDLAEFYKQTYVWDAYARTLSLTLRGGAAPTPNPQPSSLAISSQPKDVKANVSDPVSFEVTVKGGVSPYSYQWQTKQGNSGSWKNTSFTTRKMSFFVSETDISNPNYYRCIITDSSGSRITSSAVSVVSSQPSALSVSLTSEDVSIYSTETLTIGVKVSGGRAPYRYQWYFGNASGNYTGLSANTQTISFKPDSTQPTQYLKCAVIDADGTIAQTKACKITLKDNVQFSAKLDKTSMTVSASNLFRLTVTPTGGSGIYTYKWYFADGTGNFRDMTAYMSGADLATLTTYPNPQYATQYYKCLVTDRATNKSVFSDVCTMTVTGGIGQFSAKLDKTSMTVSPANLFSLTVTATGGSGAYLYKWYIGDNNGTFREITGANLATLTAYPNPQYQTQYYKCLVTDKTTAMSIYSDTCTMTLTGSIEKPLEAKLDNTLLIVGADNFFTLTVTATGGTVPYTYKWFVSDGSGSFKEYTGFTSAGGSSITTKPIPGAATRYYMCLVTDKNMNTAYSDICTVKLNSSSINPLTAELSVYSIDAPPAGVVSITCLPSGGTGPYRYNWEFSLNGITFLSTGVETQTIMIPGSSSVSVIYYRCRVKDANTEETVTKNCKVNFAR
jgi:hypothetical protein